MIHDFETEWSDFWIVEDREGTVNSQPQFVPLM